jgi:hypothetical protein
MKSKMEHIIKHVINVEPEEVVEVHVIHKEGIVRRSVYGGCTLTIERDASKHTEVKS